MPVGAPRLCGCGILTPRGSMCPCAKRRKAAAEAIAARPSASERGYDRAWRRVRGAFLAAHPTCCVKGCGQAANEADHIQSVRDRPDLRLVWSNLRPMCKRHHSQRTAKDQGFTRSTSIRPDSVAETGGRVENSVVRGETARVPSTRERLKLSFSAGGTS